MNRSFLRQLIVALLVVAVIVVNILASALPINNQTTGEISDRFNVLFVPAGYVFSIWGLIYLGLLGYAVYQFLPSQGDNPRLQKIALPFVISSVANVAWIFLWHYELFSLTLVAMVILLLSLIAVYLLLGIGRINVPPGERWLVRVPFSLYLGWITVATIANVTTLLDFLNWNGWGIAPEWWAVIMLVVATIVNASVIASRGDIIFPLVAVWAFVGIVVAQADTPFVAGTALALAGLLLVLIVVQAARGRRAYLPYT